MRRIKQLFFPQKDYVRYKGALLPPRRRRFCGVEFQDHAFYLLSAQREAQRLIDHFGCQPGSRIMDIGCGQGRLAIGLINVIGDGLDYVGVDVDNQSVEWCQKYLQADHPSFRFFHFDIANERYNKGGQPLTNQFRFNWPDQYFDIIYLYSVFSHMEEEDIRRYLTEFHRLLKPSGHVFFTTFAEENVPPFSVNPPDYRLTHYNGPLHVVRFEKNYLFRMLQEHGFEVERFDYAREANNQSGLFLHVRSANLPFRPPAP